MKKHQKHTNLEKRHIDNFAPNEFAFLGANCSVISDVVSQISQTLSSYKLAYFDASHATEVEKNYFSKYVYHHQGNVEIQTTGAVNKFEQRLQFAQYDAVFINGNHYEGAKQILILDAKKEASVLKRISQLSNIQFIIKLEEKTPIFDFLLEKYPNLKNKNCYSIHDIDKISTHINTLIKEKTPNTKGLVLVGGKSTRMGTDKALLDYYGVSQKEFASKLLEKNGVPTFYGVSAKTTEAKEIPDVFLNLGPFGSICSAFQKDPNSAWLVLATDVPFVDDLLIKKLLHHRNSSKVATAIKGIDNQFPEPLITIYEPKAYPILLQYLAMGYSCPRKMLINSDVEIVEVANHFIRNINTPEEFEKAKKEIKGK
ncbi:NTP transferase domain-containing protein [Polaribacter tangerinus]|uniref:NTP transferase domain-containing protein n=1 Tax=Polaribacter tangerinus TaxID=1920034 RepID=UPI000B4A8B9E|nr:NTP transferase domain-containing protein [Polaribacter tangerinus]